MSDEIQTLYQGRYLRLCQRGTWEYAERVNPQGAVVIVAVTPDDKVLLVEQYRIPIQSRTLEFPAGLIGDLDAHADEGWEASAQRELIEETGWSAARFESLIRGPSSAGMSTEDQHFVRAFDLTRVGPGGGDGSENIVVHEVPVAAVAAFVADADARGYRIDPKVYAGLYFIERDRYGQAWR